MWGEEDDRTCVGGGEIGQEVCGGRGRRTGDVCVCGGGGGGGGGGKRRKTGGVWGGGGKGTGGVWNGKRRTGGVGEGEGGKEVWGRGQELCVEGGAEQDVKREGRTGVCVWGGGGKGDVEGGEVDRIVEGREEDRR